MGGCRWSCGCLWATGCCGQREHTVLSAELTESALIFNNHQLAFLTAARTCFEGECCAIYILATTKFFFAAEYGGVGGMDDGWRMEACTNML